MDLPGPSACIGRDPLSHKAKGVLTGARVTNDIDPLGRKAGDLVVRGGRRPLPAPAPRPMATPGSATKRGRAWLRGVPGVQETARSAVSCTGLRGASSNSTVFSRVSSLRHGIQL